jgi:hypothetical protein
MKTFRLAVVVTKSGNVRMQEVATDSTDEATCDQVRADLRVSATEIQAWKALNVEADGFEAACERLAEFLGEPGRVELRRD